MKKNTRKLITLLTLFATLTGCSNATNPGYDGYLTEHGKNSSKTMMMIGDWTKTGIGTHYHNGADGGPMVIFGLEGLCQYVRTTDNIYMLLAESIETDPNDFYTSIVTLRENANWTDGEPVVARDFMTYWYLAHGNTTSYIYDIEETDNPKVFKIHWKRECCPSEDARLILLSQDKKCASAPYHIFKQYADPVIELTKALPDDDPEDIYYYQAHFGRKWNEEATKRQGELYSAFRAHVVEGIYPSTGPFMMESYDENTMVLKKNQNYWNAEQVGFEKMVFKRAGSLALQMLLSNEIYYLDGLPLDVDLESYLAQNQSLVNYKVLTQDCLGFMFNFQKERWNNKNVREAFQYILDRDLIRQSCAPYSTTAWTPMTGMCDYEAEKYLNPDDYNKIPQYYQDQQKAAKLLEEGGWTKKNGSWYDAANKKVELTMGTPGWSELGLMIQTAFQEFGIGLEIKNADGPTTLLANATVGNSEYDLIAYYTALNPWGSHPAGAYKHFFEQMDAQMMNIPTDPNTGRYKLTIEKADGSGTTDAWSIYEKMYTYTGDTLRQKTADLVVGISKLNLGVDLYNGLTGSFFNLDYVGNLPLVEKFSENRNVKDIYHYDDANFDEIAMTNLYFGEHVAYSQGFIKARD